MKIQLAGMNIDTKFINDRAAKIITPETISAAYARISRSKKSVTKLRKIALKEVDKARKSNRNIIYEMGHSSIAEHAVFNFDIIGVSRYLTEFIQKRKLSSFTEKSQRYVTLKGDYVLPQEIADSTLKDKFEDMIKSQNELYFEIYKELRKYLQDSDFSDNKRQLKNKAKEDARYVLALATETQMGMTINARNLERLLQRLDRINLSEATELRENLRDATIKYVPSLLKYTKAEKFCKNITSGIPAIEPDHAPASFELLDYTPDGDDRILSFLITEKDPVSYRQASNWVKELSSEKKEKIYENIFSKLTCHSSLPRAFETIDLTFSFNVSSSCFAQLKRHRMSTILKSNYSPQNGFVIPPLIKEINYEDKVSELMQKIEDLYFELEQVKKRLGNYILTNSHRIPVIFKTNLRELYHFSRLRSDSHAQWEIRNLSHQIDKEVKKIYPFAAKYLMGKDQFREKQQND